MIRHRAKSILLYSALMLLSCRVFGARPIQPAIEDSETSYREAAFEPGIVPTSAVAAGGNCARIASIEEQFEGGITAQDLQRIQGPEQGRPLGVSGKFRLAVANLSDPFSLITTALDAEIGNATEGPSPLQRGAAGFGQRMGASLAGQASGEFFSTFLVSSLFHQDPHYHRDPGAPGHTRIARALSYVLVTRSDSGKRMFNFAEFLGTASSSVLENNFHPEWEKGAGPTANRIFVSIGSDAGWNLMTEFLPDIARHLNPRLFLLRRLAERAAEQN